MIARLGRASSRPRPRGVIYDAEHFFDGYKDDRDYALAHAAGRRQARRRGRLVLCDTNGGTLTDELVGIVTTSRRVAGRRSRRPPGHPHPQRRASCAVANSLAAVRGGRSARSRAPSTATASAAATPTW